MFQTLKRAALIAALFFSINLIAVGNNKNFEQKSSSDLNNSSNEAPRTPQLILPSRKLQGEAEEGNNGSILFATASKENSEPPKESLKSILTQAQDLLLSKNRDQAIKILTMAIKSEKANSKNQIELKNTLKKAAEIFFSEKSQQTYEMAIAVYYNDKHQAKEKFLEVLKQEPNNSLILKALLFTSLSLKDCTNAKLYLKELKNVNEFDEEIEHFQVLNLVCVKNKSEALALIAKMDPAILNQTFWIVNKQRIMGSGSEVPLLNRNVSTDYPELLYVYWTQEKSPKEKIILAERYKQLCQTPINYDKAYSYTDPWVCEHLKEISD